jgi:two-component system cell cycle sensor histidine kinase/response regulator CckA
MGQLGLQEGTRLAGYRAGDLDVLRRLAADESLADVLAAIVRNIESMADGMLGTVMLVEDATVRVAAAPSFPESFAHAFDGEPIGPRHGSCGTAAWRKEPVIVEDIATDPLWERYRMAALDMGLRACWSVPIFGPGDEVVGTFALYYRQPRRPTPELVELAEHASHLASIAITRERAREALVEGARRREVDDLARRALETEMRHLQKMEAISRLSGGIAHDFNNLLSVILLAANTLDETLEDPAQRELVHEVLSAAKRGAALTRQFLAMSRKQQRDPEVLEVDRVVRDLQPMLRRLLPANIELEVRATGKPWRVEADRGQLEQVVVNLVVNARDAIADGGHIVVETSATEVDDATAAQHVDLRPGPYAVLSVTDDGSGMDDAVRARIFEPFFTTKSAERGTGLGLATVYGIVRQSDGHVWVESEPGKGSTFRVLLPCTDKPLREKPPTRRTPRSARSVNAP